MRQILAFLLWCTSSTVAALEFSAQDKASTPTRATTQRQPSDREMELFRAVEREDIGAIEKLLSDGVNVDAHGDHGFTPLMIAASRGLDKAAKYLIERGAKVNMIITTCVESLTPVKNRDKVYCEDISPLSHAVLFGREQLVSLLLEHSANPEVTSQNTPVLIKAIIRNNTPIALDLIKAGADPNKMVVQADETPLTAAIRNKNRTLTEALLKKGANPVQQGREEKSAPALSVFLCSDEYDGPWRADILKLFFRYYPDINFSHYRGNTGPLLDCAVREGDTKTVKIMLDHGADPRQENDEGHSAYIKTIDIKHDSRAEILQTFLGHYADRSIVKALLREVYSEGSMDDIKSVLRQYVESPLLDCPFYVAGPSRSDEGMRINKPVRFRGENFPDALYSGVDGINMNHGLDFMMSPNGKWLIHMKSNTKYLQNKSQTSIAFVATDIDQKKHYILVENTSAVSGALSGWTEDAKRFAFELNSSMTIVDFSSGTPVTMPGTQNSRKGRRVNDEFSFKAGIACRFRKYDGEVVYFEPGDSDRYAWSVDGKTHYVAKKNKRGGYEIQANTGNETHVLIKHTQSYAKEATSNRWSILSQSQYMASDLDLVTTFKLSPTGEYLYYEIGTHGWWGHVRQIVVDTQDPLNIWEFKVSPGHKGDQIHNVAWHPNGKDLYFIYSPDQQKPDPNFPPMRQPGWKQIGVAYFP